MANILVVDDYRDTAESMAMWLKYFGHDVQIARDGHQAIEIARRQRPRMSCSISACPTSTVIRSPPPSAGNCAGRSPSSPSPVSAGRRTAAGRLAAGCDHYLLKPIDPAALIVLLPPTPQPDSPARRDADRGHDPRGRPVLSRREVEITNTLGLHLRAAAKFVSLAQQFQAEIRVACDGRKASGRSILDLATLAADCGSRLELDADGSDAEAALDALTDLIGRRFDEDG